MPWYLVVYLLIAAFSAGAEWQHSCSKTDQRPAAVIRDVLAMVLLWWWYLGAAVVGAFTEARHDR